MRRGNNTHSQAVVWWTPTGRTRAARALAKLRLSRDSNIAISSRNTVPSFAGEETNLHGPCSPRVNEA